MTITYATPDQAHQLLAEHALAGNTAEAAFLVWLLADHSHTEESLQAAWSDFREAIRAREALACGERVWQELYDPEDCSGTDHAIELLATRADDAFRLLREGPRETPLNKQEPRAIARRGAAAATRPARPADRRGQPA